MCHMHGWERRTILLDFFSKSCTSVSPKEEKRESEIFLRLFFFDIFQTLIYKRNESVFGFMELSQEKPFTLI